jgi:hypothetical protein
MCLLIVLLGKTGRPARAVLQFSSAGVRGTVRVVGAASG